MDVAEVVILNYKAKGRVLHASSPKDKIRTPEACLVLSAEVRRRYTSGRPRLTHVDMPVRRRA